jgi:D-threo-aldose 1-dehydrogenase
MPLALFAPCVAGPVAGLRLGLGGAPLGNLFAPVTAGEASATVTAAWAGGCRSFDTAPHYGHGLSEHRLGDALRGLTHQGAPARDSFVLSSKVGRLLRPNPAAARNQHGYVDVLPFDQHWDYSADGVRRSLEDSLQRLGLARIDVAYVHDCDAATHGLQATAVLRQVLSQTLPALQRLKAEGLVRAIGLGVNDVAVVQAVLREAELDALLLAGRYSLLDHSALPELLPQCAARGVHLALGGVFNSGILASGSRGANASFNYAPAAGEWLERTARIEAVCERHAVPLRAAALQFVMAHPAVEIVMLGARSAAEWRDAQAMARHPIAREFWLSLREAGLLPADAPTP